MDCTKYFILILKGCKRGGGGKKVLLQIIMRFLRSESKVYINSICWRYFELSELKNLIVDSG